MKNIYHSFVLSWKVLAKNKIILLFSTMPILIGTLLYVWLGSWFYGDLLSEGKKWIGQHVTSQGLGPFFNFLLVGILTIVFFFVISWTFVLLTAFIASPFHDIISCRTERYLLGEVPQSISESLKETILKIKKILVNEIKKIIIIAGLSIMGIALSFFPLLTPISLLISAWLMTATFLDYSWSRHEYSVGSCFDTLKKGFLVIPLLGWCFYFSCRFPLSTSCLYPWRSSISRSFLFGEIILWIS